MLKCNEVVVGVYVKEDYSQGKGVRFETKRTAYRIPSGKEIARQVCRI